MHVLHVNHTLDPEHGGGTAERTFQLCRFLVRQGFQCTLLTTAAGAGATRAAELPGVRALVLPLVSQRFFVPRVSWRKLRDAVASADVIHLMGHWTLLNALVYCTARVVGTPYVVCPAGALPIFGRSSVIKRFYNFMVGKRIVRGARACVAITPQEFPQFEAYGVPRERVVVIPNGIADEDFMFGDVAAFRAKFALGDAPFVLFMGRLNYIKGPDLLLRAFARVQARFPDFHLVYAGPDSGMLGELKSIAREHGVASVVHFLGALGGEDRTAAYRAASLLAIPSRQEAMSIVVLEAGISGTPVLLTDQCGFDSVNGRGALVVPADEAALARGLEHLLADAGRLPEMGRTLQAVTREQHRWDSVIRSYVALYNTLLAEPGPADGPRDLKTLAGDARTYAPPKPNGLASPKN